MLTSTFVQEAGQTDDMPSSSHLKGDYTVLCEIYERVVEIIGGRHVMSLH